MGIMVGTLVTRYYFDEEYENREMDTSGPDCARYISPIEMDKTEVCVGLVIEESEASKSDNPDFKVKWLQMCSDHLDHHPMREWVNNDSLWEIGQIA